MRIGVDLGGTKIEAIALDEGGVERARRRTRTPQDQGYDAIVRALADLVRAIEAEVGPSSVGVGTPGAISPRTKLLKNSNTVCLNGRPLDRDLCTALAREVRVANDADCFALSEATDGAAQGEPIVFGVIVGTGVGGGIVAHGRLLSGPNAIAGEWGHDPLPWSELDERPGPSCYCGKQGCVEAWISGPALSADHERRSGVRLDGSAIAASEDPAARATMQRWLDRFARASATVVNVLDPHAVVVGGGLSNVSELYDAVPRAWSRYVFGGEVATRLVPARYGDSSGVRGAAWLWR